jgi:hypothetical protein
MKANVTGYQPYLQQTENMADENRNVMLTSHNYNVTLGTPYFPFYRH